MKHFTFTVEIKSGTVTALEKRTLDAATLDMATTILRATLAVVYGPGRARIIGAGKEAA
jgi:hypothetical protein